MIKIYIHNLHTSLSFAMELYLLVVNVPSLLMFAVT